MTIKDIIGYQPIDLVDMKGLKELELAEEDKSLRWLMIEAYLYGFIQGKREERSRKHNRK